MTTPTKTKWDELRYELARVSARYISVAEMYERNGRSAADVVEAVRLRDKAAGLEAALRLMNAIDDE